MNPGKEEIALRLFSPYQDAMEEIQKLQWRGFYETGRFSKNLDIKVLGTKINARFKQTAQYQVVGVLNSFIENRKNDFIKIIQSYKFKEEDKIKLLFINKYGLWFNFMVWMNLELVPKELIFLARKIFRQVLRKHKHPSFKNQNLNLDFKVCKFEKSTKGKFDYWVTLSTLTKGKPVRIPIQTNRYFENQIGPLNNFLQLNRKGNKIEFRFSKDLEPLPYTPRSEGLALDKGLCTLLATDKGDLFGHIFDRLKVLDKKITQYASDRQKRKLPVKTENYDRLQRRAKDLLKNETNRIVNRILVLYAPKRIIIEDLDFTHPNLSKRMNRLVRNYMGRQLRAKLKSVSELYGIEIQEVNCRYTSCTCPSCGYVDKLNRKSQAKFECLVCGLKKNADVVGAKNIWTRSSSFVLASCYSKQRTSDSLIGEFVARWEPFGGLQGSLYSKALATFGKSNILLKGFLQRHPVASPPSAPKTVLDICL